MGADRRPLSGVRTFDLVDEFTVRVSVSPSADEYGQFALEGIWPGVWRVSLDGDDKTVELPDGGEASVELKTRHDAAGLHRAPRRRSPRSARSSSRTSDRRTGRRPREWGDGVWRAAVRGGEARFPRLVIGEWLFIVERPGLDERGRTADVVPGDGPQTIVFTPR